MATVLFSTALALMLLIAQAARADPSSAETDIWRRSTLTGGWGGLAAGLNHEGLQFNSTFIGEWFGDISGGAARGGSAESRLELDLDADLGVSLGWPNAKLHASAFLLSGAGLSANQLGNNLLTVSNIEARPSLRLFTLWLEQTYLDDRLSVRVGQLAADDEFFVSPTGSTLLNGTFGWSALFSGDLPSGGAAYPLATPGIRLRYQIIKPVTVLAAVFSGDPAGKRSSLDPERANPSGTTFSFSDGPVVFIEAQISTRLGASGRFLPGTVRLGGWYHDGFAQDQFYFTSREIFQELQKLGLSKRRKGDGGGYIVVDQMLWNAGLGADRGVAAFLRIAVTPSDRRLIDLYVDSGLSAKGVLGDRPADTLSLGLAYTRVSQRARRISEEAHPAGEADRAPATFEAAIELSYQAQLTPWMTLQPDIQYIVHPCAGFFDPNAPPNVKSTPNALVVGVRAVVAF